MKKNPFGDESGESRKNNPFGSDDTEVSPAEAVTRIEQAARKIRSLRAQLGAEGLTMPASRDLIDETATALEMSARTLRRLLEKN